MKYVITKNQRSALSISIENWTKLINGETISSDDPMCAVGSCRCRIPNGQLRCVIDLHTGGKDCSDTPYSKFDAHVRKNHYDHIVDGKMQTFCPECIVLARENLDYLIDLKSHCSVETADTPLNTYNMGYANPEFALLWENLGNGMHKLRIANIPSNTSLPVHFSDIMSQPIVCRVRASECDFGSETISIMCKSGDSWHYLSPEKHITTRAVNECIESMKLAYARLVKLREELHPPLQVGDEVTGTAMYISVHGGFSSFSGTIEKIEDGTATIGFGNQSNKKPIDLRWCERQTQEYIDYKF